MTVNVGDKIVVACDSFKRSPRGSICVVYRVTENGVYATPDGYANSFFFKHTEYTPYIEPAQEAALQQLADMGQAFDAAPRFAVSVVKEDLPKEYAGAKDKAAPEADGWITHDGSAKRPKGVGKRDRLDVYLQGGNHPCFNFTWSALDGSTVTRYRVTKRAEKRRKVWVVHTGYGCFINFGKDKSGACEYAKEVKGKLCTAKLKEVTE